MNPGADLATGRRAWPIAHRIAAPVLVAACVAACAWGLATSSVPLEAEVVRALVPAAVEAFFDRVVGGGLAEHRVPGAAVAVVQDGRVVLLKGYGFADLERLVPVDPQVTVFRVASVSKLFTIAAVLQLVEEGALALDDDVNLHLSELSVDSPFDVPVRVRHLLEHSDGFGTRDLATFTLDPDAVLPLGTVLAQELRAPVVAPGQVVTYGGYGTALAGHLVAELSGRRFEDQVAERLFLPLGMTRSSFDQHLPADWVADLATVYDDVGSAHQAAPFLYLHTPPTGGMSTTAGDMASMLLMLLGDGRSGEQAVLAPTSLRMMLSRQFSPHPELPGLSFGLMEHRYQGHVGLVRDGSGLGLRAQVALWPELGLGYFYVQNARGDGIVETLTERFLDELVGRGAGPTAPEGGAATVPGVQTGAAPDGFPDPPTGVFRPAQTNNHTLVKLESLLIGELRASVKNGLLTITPRGMGDVYGGLDQTSSWVQTAPGVFRRLDREHDLAVVNTQDGRVVLCSGSGYHGCYVRVPWTSASEVQFSILAACLATFLAAMVLGAFGPRAGRRKEGATGRLAHRLTLACSTGFLVGFCAAAYGLFLQRVAGLPAFAVGITPVAAMGIGLMLLAAIFSVGMWVAVALAWGRWPWGTRLWHGWVSLASVVFVAWLHAWNLLGLRV